MQRLEKAHLADWHRGIREIIKQLDKTNVKILSAMGKYGPRNLLEVSRRTGIPFTSVYHRVAKLEAKSNRIAALIPQVSHLGLVRVVVLVTAKPGCENKVTDALKIPKYWRSVNRCEGIYTHFSVQIIPAKALKQFRQYMKKLLDLKLVTKSNLILTGEYVPNVLNFKCYNAATNEWTFQWGRWLVALRRKPSYTIEDPASYEIRADKKDLLIVKELEKNGRKSFAELAPLLGISLQGVKYHYDKKLVPSGIVRYFDYEVWPYPEEISAHHEIFVEFRNAEEMYKFYSLARELFFVRGVSKVLHQNALLLRTFIIQNLVPSLFSFLSEVAREGHIESYSAIRQNFVDREIQGIPWKLYDEETGWDFNLRRYISEAAKLAKGAGNHKRVMVPRAGVS